MKSNPRCQACRYTVAKFACLCVSLLCWLPCLAVERWYFYHAGGWRESVAVWLMRGYYALGREWPSRAERKWCRCRLLKSR
jgi:hypothetical protein